MMFGVPPGTPGSFQGANGGPEFTDVTRLDHSLPCDNGGIGVGGGARSLPPGRPGSTPRGVRLDVPS